MFEWGPNYLVRSGRYKSRDKENFVERELLKGALCDCKMSEMDRIEGAPKYTVIFTHLLGR